MTNRLESNRLDLESLLRVERLPHVWCPGCGIGVAFASLLRAMVNVGINLDKTVMVSGIGCTGRAAGYVCLDSFHTTHGRAVPFAEGLKLARPDLNVIVFSGDGDLFAIGGNHILHAARRNHDVLVICVNNYIYGMTGGQHGPTTPTGALSTTTPYGNPDRPMNLPHFMISLNTPFVARWTQIQPRKMIDTFEKALQRKGFRFIEMISVCPTEYGRKNRMGDPVQAMKFLKENTLVKPDADFEEMNIRPGYPIVVGEFRDIPGEMTYEERYDEIIRRVRGA